MNCQAVLKKLESCGSAQTRKTYGRHGVEPPLFGVSYKDLGILTRQLKTDHQLALELWDSGNHDARVLATMIADPAKLKSTQVDRWAREVNNYVLGDAFSTLVANSPLAEKKANRWRAARSEWLGYAGWSITSRLAAQSESLPDDYFAPLIAEIEHSIHAAPNRVRHAMNQTLISIGVYRPRLRKRVLAAAKRIGKVEVDHGQTNCQTPDAAAYIAKTVAHREQAGGR